MIDLTTLEGADTPGKVRSLCAKARAPRPERPDHPAGRRGLRLRRPGRRRREALERHRHPRRRRRHRVPLAAAPAARSSSPTPRTPSPPAPTRSTWSSTAARSWPGATCDVFEEIVAVKEACARTARRPPQGDPRDRRAGHLRQRPARVLAGDAGRRRLHQDLHRQDRRPPRPCRSRWSCSRRCATCARADRRQVGVKPAGGIRTTKDAHQVPGAGQRDRRRRTGSTRTGSGSAPPACSTTCCCSGRSCAPAHYSGPDYVTLD